MKTIKHILSVVLMGVALASCDDLFEPAQENLKDVSSMYGDASYAQGILGNAYILLPYSNSPKNRLNAIQYVNIMVANADKVAWSTDEGLQRLFSDLFKGDAYGMRALQMFYLLRAHAGMVDGVNEMMGVPILREFQEAGADFNQPRATQVPTSTSHVPPSVHVSTPS